MLTSILSACVRQEVVDDNPHDEWPPVPSVEKVQVPLFMQTHDYQAPVLRSMADENGIDTASMVLIFSGSDENALYVETVQAFALNSINKRYIMPTKQAGACRMLILTNTQDYFYISGDNTPYEFTIAKLDAVLSGKTLSYACENLLTEPLSDPQTTVPYAGNKRIPMSYLLNVPSIDEHTQIGTSSSPLKMERVTAKLLIKSNLQDFTFDAVLAVVNTPKQGRLHQLGATLMNNTANLAEYNAGNYLTDFITTTVNGTEQNININPIYLYESGTPNNTHILIKGSYKGKVGYYRLFVKDSSKNPINLLRNHQYSIDITSVQGPGFATISDLIKASDNHTDIDYKVTIVDASAFETTANEQYYLSVSNSVFIAYADVTSEDEDAIDFEVFTVTTNCTINFENDNYIVHDNTDWAIRLKHPGPVEGLPPDGLPYKTRIPIATNSNAPVSTPVIADIRGYANADYKFILKLGDLEKVVYPKVGWGTAIPASGETLWKISPWDDFYLFSGEVMGDARDWIKLMPGTNVVRNDSASITVDDGIIYVRIEPNNTGQERSGIVYFGAGNKFGNNPGDGSATSFRIKVYIAQRKD